MRTIWSRLSDCFSAISVRSPELPASGVARSRAREGREGREGRGRRGPQLSVSITASARPAVLDPGRASIPVPSVPSVP